MGKLAAGQTPSDDDMDVGYEALKLMLRSWSSDITLLHFVTAESISLTGAASYTIGESGSPDLNTVRPVSIESAYIENWGALDIVPHKEYLSARIVDAPTAPGRCWYNPTYPNGTLYVDTSATGTMYLDSYKQLTEPATITADAAFPPEYDDAIKFNLAKRLAPEFGVQIQPDVLMMAQEALDNIVQKNFAEQIAAVPIDVLRLSGSRYTIEGG